MDVLLPILIALGCALGIAAFVAMRRSAWARDREGASELAPGVLLRLVHVDAPEGIVDCAHAISSTLDEVRPGWRDRMELVIEWRPYGSPITGPYVKTGFVTRGPSTVAVMPPVPPFVAGLEEKVARVLGTCRYAKPWPWSSFRRATVVLMDGRVGATRRQVLLGEGADLPRTPARATALFYEVAWRAVPVAIDGKGVAELPTGEPAAPYKAIEVAMKGARR